MLIFDRRQRSWACISGATFLVALGFYLWLNWTTIDGLRGGTQAGLVYGIIAAGMMIYAGLLGARRRFSQLQWLGSGAFWMRSHLWIGTLAVPFSAFHAGFRWGGPLEILLWGLVLIVVVSGFWGLVMQNVVPKMMLDQLSRETFIEQIPHLCQQFMTDADKLLTTACGPLELQATERAGLHDAVGKQSATPSALTLASVSAVSSDVVTRTGAGISETPDALQREELKQIYLKLVRPCLDVQPANSVWKENLRRAILACRVRTAAQHPQLIPILDELRDYCEQRQQFALIEWYHFWLHRWLVIHIPATVALYVVLFAHGISALRVIPFGN